MEEKKKAAAVTAVIAYLKAEEEGSGLPRPGERPLANLWALSGRQAIMQAGRAVAMRLFGGTTYRATSKGQKE